MNGLCPQCLEVLKNPAQCMDCGWTDSEAVVAEDEHIKRVEATLKLGDLKGEEGNIWIIMGRCRDALMQLGASQDWAEKIMDGWMSRSYVENLRWLDDRFNLVIDGFEDLDDFLMWYEGVPA